MRFHVHTHVDDLQASIAFYSKMFAAEPVRVEADYAKWHLENPRLNFAISARGSRAGIDHLGFQADDAEELVQLKARAQAADASLLDDGVTTCCYARSEKHWVTDPQGIAWEHYQTLGDIPVFSESQPGAVVAQRPVTATAGTAIGTATQTADTSAVADAPACCAPRGKPVGIPVRAGSSCC